jgi:hypothetical protein
MWVCPAGLPGFLSWLLGRVLGVSGLGQGRAAVECVGEGGGPGPVLVHA